MKVRVLTSAHLYKLNGAWPVAWESVARDDLRLDPGHDGKHDLHLADHGISSLHSCLLRIGESAKNIAVHVATFGTVISKDTR